MLYVSKPNAASARYVGPGKLIAPKTSIRKTKRALRRSGFEILGMGASQVALSKPHGRRVVKLSAGKHTGGWAAIQMFLQYPEIEEFPRVYGVVELKDGAWAVEMERLKPDRRGDYGAEVSEEMGHSYTYTRLADTWGWRIADAFAETWAGFVDLHSYNWMLRGETAVIVDPFNSWDGISEADDTLRQLGTRAHVGDRETEFWRGIH